MFELHTLGAENYLGVASTVGQDGQYHHPAPAGDDGMPLLYVDEDIYSATQCFTGWRINRGTGAFRLRGRCARQVPKIVLGV